MIVKCLLHFWNMKQSFMEKKITKKKHFLLNILLQLQWFKWAFLAGTLEKLGRGEIKPILEGILPLRT